MMTANNLYQDFGAPRAQPADSAGVPEEELEDHKLEAFERGYQAGWDDSSAAQKKSVLNVSEALASNLQAASFEYNELRFALNTAVQELMTQVLDRLLPTVARASLGAQLIEKIEAAAGNALERTIEVTIAPENEQAIQAVLEGHLDGPFALTTDASLNADQVILRLSEGEAELDLEKTVTELATLVSSYFATNVNEVSHD